MQHDESLFAKNGIRVNGLRVKTYGEDVKWKVVLAENQMFTFHIKAPVDIQWSYAIIHHLQYDKAGNKLQKIKHVSRY